MIKQRRFAELYGIMGLHHDLMHRLIDHLAPIFNGVELFDAHAKSILISKAENAND